MIYVGLSLGITSNKCMTDKTFIKIAKLAHTVTLNKTNSLFKYRIAQVLLQYSSKVVSLLRRLLYIATVKILL